MIKSEKRCNNCGSKMHADATYCRQCSTSFSCNKSYTLENQNKIINGIPVNDLRERIDRHSNYYLDVFRKHKDNKVFIHFNWSAMFGGGYWFIYRNMKKHALIWLLIVCIINILSVTMATVLYQEEYDSINNQITIINNEPYPSADELDWTTSESNKIIYDNIIHKFEESAINQSRPIPGELINARLAIVFKIFLIVSIPFDLFNLIIGLFANCLYRQYLLNVNNPGGIHIGSRFVFSLLAGFCMTLSVTLGLIIGFLIN